MNDGLPLTLSLRPYLEQQHPGFIEGWEVTKVLHRLSIMNGSPSEASAKKNSLTFEREIDEDQALELAVEELTLVAEAPEGHVFVLVERPSTNPVLLTVTLATV